MRIWRVAIRSTHGASGTQFVNTLAVRMDNGTELPPELPADQVCDEVYAWLFPEYKAMLNPVVTVEDIHARSLTGDPEEDSRAVSEVGTGSFGAGDYLPRQVTMVMTFKTATPTRRGRGRIFIPSPINANPLSNEQVWDPANAYWINAGTFATALLTGSDFIHDGTPFHASLNVWSSLDGVGRDVVSATRRPAPRWLRSRTTAP